jgi:single-strand DNA-binding protein
MQNINRVTLLGNLGRDPEVKYTPTGLAVCNASLATQKSWKKDGEWKKNTTWHKVVAWRKLADLLGTATKGDQVLIEGELTQRSWENKEGAKQYVTEVLASVVVVIGKEQRPQAQSPSQQSDEGGDFGPDASDDVPF